MRGGGRRATREISGGLQRHGLAELREREALAGAVVSHAAKLEEVASALLALVDEALDTPSYETGVPDETDEAATESGLLPDETETDEKDEAVERGAAYIARLGTDMSVWLDLGLTASLFDEFSPLIDYDGDGDSNDDDDRAFREQRLLPLGSEFKSSFDYDGDGEVGTDADRAAYSDIRAFIESNYIE